MGAVRLPKILVLTTDDSLSAQSLNYASHPSMLMYRTIAQRVAHVHVAHVQSHGP